MEDPTEFPYGPYVAVLHPFGGNNYRIEKACENKPGCCFPPIEDYKKIPDYKAGWKTLEVITPMIELLNNF